MRNILNFVEAIDNFENASGFSTPLTVNIEYISCRFEKVASGTQGDAGTIEKFSLNANYPNPFNPTTTIAFALPQSRTAGPVRLTVFDSNGRQIAELVNKQLPAGNYEIPFDASALSSGVYFYRLTANAFTQTNKMMLLK